MISQNVKSKQTKTSDKKMKFVVTRGGRLEIGELNEGGQKVQTSNYK